MNDRDTTGDVAATSNSEIEIDVDGLAFARRMRDPMTMMTPDWQIDWRDAPYPYKRYVGVERLPLSSFPDLGRLLHRTYGLTRCRLRAAPPLGSVDEGATDAARGALRVRRPIASGGGLYPAELYVYVRDFDGARPGLYHYDVAHHSLARLRTGNIDAALERAMLGQLEMDESAIVLFATVSFWKNRFKYADFGYRLSAVDAGILVGQIDEIARDQGLSSVTCLCFSDARLAQMIGIDGIEESPYAAVVLTREPSVRPSATPPCAAHRGALTEHDLPSIHVPYHERSKSIKVASWAAAMHRASIAEPPAIARALPPITWQQAVTNRAHDQRASRLRLPPPGPAPSRDRLDDALARRSSAGESFTFGPITRAQLANILSHAVRPIAVDVLGDAAASRPLRRPRVGVVVHDKLDLPTGVYVYDPSTNALTTVRHGSYADVVHRSVRAQNLNLLAAAATFHLLAEEDHGAAILGARGYRIDHMLAGVMVQRIQLAATIAEMQGHPLLGFDVDRIDDLYGSRTRGLTALAAVPVGHTRWAAYLEGRL